MNREGFAPIVVLSVLAGILILVGGIWYYESHRYQACPTDITIDHPVVSAITFNGVNYGLPDYGFSGFLGHAIYAIEQWGPSPSQGEPSYATGCFLKAFKDCIPTIIRMSGVSGVDLTWEYSYTIATSTRSGSPREN